MLRQTLVLLLDADGSIYNGAYNKEMKRFDRIGPYDYPSSHQYVLETANSQLFDWIVDLVICRKYTHLIIMSGSNRVSYNIDQYNADENYTGLFNLDLATIKTLVEQRLASKHANVHVTHDPFLLVDIANQLPSGSAYNTMHAAAKMPNQPTQHPDCSSDKVKFTPHYCSLQHVAKHYPASHVIFLDDTRDILDVLGKHMQKHPHLIPVGLTVEYRFYAGFTNWTDWLTGELMPLYQSAIAWPTVKGTGDINPYLSDAINHLRNAYNEVQTKSYDTVIRTLHEQLASFLQYHQAREKINGCIDRMQAQTTPLSSPATFFMQVPNLKITPDQVITHGIHDIP